MKKLFTDFNMKERLKALSQNEIVRKLVPSLLLGILIAVSLSYVTPLSSAVFFAFQIVSLIGLIVIFAYYKEFRSLRIIFLGASITSLIFAFRTFFFSLIINEMVQITFDNVWGLFRSVLLTSLFSLLERLTKFIEDKTENRKPAS